MTTLFISDLHLEKERPDITQAFFHFIDNTANHAESLYILGDFFEAWIGDDFEDEFTNKIKSKLKSLSDKGVSINLMHGNRDFLIGHDFCASIGCTLLKDPTVINLYNNKILLCHGDHLCTQDKDYMKFRNMVRNTEWQRDFLNRPITERLTIARQLRDASQHQTPHKDNAILDVTPTEIAPFMEKFGVNTLIHGHTHRPSIHKLFIANTPAQRIVLGDWYQQQSYLIVKDGAYDLKFKTFSS
jgi:UDP-2,3-diacylglucosamine hydrolase